MSDIIESIKQSAGQVLSDIDQKGQLKSALEGLKHQWSELERRRRVSSLTSQVRTQQGEMKQLTEALGLQTLSLYDAGSITHPELARLCERINEIRSDIDQKKAELADLKGPTTVPAAQCPQCKAGVATDAEFCPKCGAALEKKDAEAPAPATTATVVRMRCPRCKTILPDGATFCPTCGAKLRLPQAQAEDRRFCPSCGAQTNPGARFCPICGQALG